MRNLTDNRKTIHRSALAGAMVTVIAALVATALMVTAQLTGAAPASAVNGLHREVGSSAINSRSPKTAWASCPPGERVVGGGGRAESAGAFTTKLTLRQLQPVQGSENRSDRYEVTAAETTPGTNGTWLVRAYALCAPASSLSGYHITTSSQTDLSSQSVQAATAECPDQQRVLGTGGRVINVDDEVGVGLQVARASATGDIARAQAHEEAGGYPHKWSVVSYAVCVNPPPGYEIVTGQSDQRLSESVKFASVDCPAGKQVHGVGAAVTETAPGHVSLQAVNTLDDLDGLQVFAVENIPYANNWDFIIARAVCAF